MDIENGSNVHENEALVSEQEVTNEVQIEEQLNGTVEAVSNEVASVLPTTIVAQPEVEHTQVAEEAEEEHELAEESDFSQYSAVQLLEISEELSKESSFRKIDNTLRLLKIEIDRINREEKDAQLLKFTEAGGEEDGFAYKQDEAVEKFYANYKSLKEKI